MRSPWIPALLSVAFLPMFCVNAPVWAQDMDNEAIAAAKKASLIIEGKGNVPIKPNAFIVKVDITVEKTGRTPAQTEYQHSIDTLHKALTKAGFRPGDSILTQILRRNGDSSFQVFTGPESQDPPNSEYQLMGSFSLGIANPAKAKEAFAVMRATGVQANVTLYHYTNNEEAARLVALKAAVTQAKQRVQILNEAAKPKEFELIFLKEGDFQISPGTTFARLQGKELLGTLDTISADANIVLFYNLKPVTAVAAPKVVATKARPERSKKP